VRPAAVIGVLLATTLLWVGKQPAVVTATPGTSDAGVAPVQIAGGPGGNVACSDIPSDVPLTSSERLEWEGGVLDGTVPEGIEVSIIDDRSVTWTSVFPVFAVIVKGGPASHVYLYAPAMSADAGLIPPLGRTGRPVDVGVVTFCWVPEPPDPPTVEPPSCNDVDANGEIGPIPVRGGVIDAADVPVEITSISISGEGVTFASTVLVVGLLVIADSLELYALSEPLLTATVPIPVDPEVDLDLTFCLLRESVAPVPEPTPDPEPAPSVDPVATTSQDPVRIGTGGGPWLLLPLALLGLAVLAFGGSQSLLRRSRTD